MKPCPGCLGQGRIDLRDDDAIIWETWTDEELAQARASGFQHPMGIMDCAECGTTGEVTDERAEELHAVARAQVEIAMQAVEAREGVDWQ